ATPAKAANAAHDGAILGEGAVAGERREFGEEPGDIIRAVRPLGMARDQHLLPGRELGIGLTQLPIGLGLKARRLVGDVDVAAVREVPQRLDLALQLGDWLFEFEEMPHWAGCLAQPPARGHTVRATNRLRAVIQSRYPAAIAQIIRDGHAPIRPFSPPR